MTDIPDEFIPDDTVFLGDHAMCDRCDTALPFGGITGHLSPQNLCNGCGRRGGNP